MKRSVHIDRLGLDLRGIDPVLAEAAVRLLGPALEARLSGGPAIQRGSDAHALAHHLADRVASQLPTQRTEQEHAARRTD
jgi:butyrate kinase